MTSNKPNEKKITVSTTYEKMQPIPGFRIKGKWLLNLGFKPHEVCRLTFEKGVINISKIDTL